MHLNIIKQYNYYEQGIGQVGSGNEMDASLHSLILKQKQKGRKSRLVNILIRMHIIICAECDNLS